MNTLYATYIPAINAYLNPLIDTSCKTWGQVVNVFFRLNVDVKFASKTDLADTFSNASHPNYFRIQSKSVDHYFDTFKISASSLTKEGFSPNADFIEDEEGLRLSFSTMRWIVFREGDRALIEMFDLIDKIYQTYVRYELAMMNRSRRPTHWTIFERIDEFTKIMMPHIDHTAKKEGEGPKFTTMDEQPQVLCIVTGTLKTIKARAVKYKKETVAYNEFEELTKAQKKSIAKPPTSPKFDTEPIIPIYEFVLPNGDEEIDAVIAHLENTYVLPYRKGQIGTPGPDNSPIATITGTKQHMKVMKTCILIDVEQEEYTSDNLAGDIEHVRSMLKQGKAVGSKKKSSGRLYPKESGKGKSSKKNGDSNDINSVDINIFNDTKGKQIDELNLIKLKSRDDSNVSLVEDVKSEIEEVDDWINDDTEDEEDEDEPMDIDDEPTVSKIEPKAKAPPKAKNANGRRLKLDEPAPAETKADVKADIKAESKPAARRSRTSRASKTNVIDLTGEDDMIVSSPVNCLPDEYDTDDE